MTKMTKRDMLESLAMLRRYLETHDNAVIRADAVPTADSLIAAIGAMPDVEPQPEYLQADYATVRSTLASERQMRMSAVVKCRHKQRKKVAEIDVAGKALGRMAKALGLRVPAVIDSAEPEMQQPQLIGVPAGREVAV